MRHVFLAGTSRQGDCEIEYDRGFYQLQLDAPFIVRNRIHEEEMLRQFMLMNSIAEQFVREWGADQTKEILFGVRRDFFISFGWKVCPDCAATRLVKVTDDDGVEHTEMCTLCQYRGYVPLTEAEEKDIDIMDEYVQEAGP